MDVASFKEAIASTRSVLAATSKDQLDLETPCASWTVSGLIDHIVGGHYFFTAGVNGTEMPSGEGGGFASGDFLSAYDEASAQSVAAFSGEGVMEKILTLPFGQFPGSAFISLATTDVLAHGWDLARATGQSTDLAPELSAKMHAIASVAIQPAFRGPEGAPFGPEQVAPAGATNADRLAALLGRVV